jgi:E3 ubiquitin-protein ligase ATL4
MGADDIDSIPVLTCSHTEAKAMAVSGENCSVCLEGFCTNQTLRKLPGCCHAFHADCIDPWLRKKADCPVCRRPVKASDEGKE